MNAAGSTRPLRGITWDHPRGRHALEAAAHDARRAGGLDLTWSSQPLEGFESHPVADLAERFDLLVIDHPHLGEAIDSGALRPLDDLVDADRLERWAAAAVGPSWSSYAAEGRQWALPLDAATQVAARRPTVVDQAPDTWGEVERLSRRVPVALSLAGPHAFLTFASLCVSLGSPLGGVGELHAPGGDEAVPALVDTDTGLTALDLLASIGSAVPAGSEVLNPIALLEQMAGTDEIGYCPLVYGYVTYSGHGVAYADAPRAVPGGRRGSTLGGTGIAVSARAEVTPALVEHLAWLMSRPAQVDFVPRHDGQPSSRAAWSDPDVDAGVHGFYSATLATTEQAWVRPRYAGYIAFQAAAAALVRDVAAGRLSPVDGLRGLRAAHATSSTATPRPALVTTPGA